MDTFPSNYRVVRKVSARWRELVTLLGARSRNLAGTLWTTPYTVWERVKSTVWDNKWDIDVKIWGQYVNGILV